MLETSFTANGQGKVSEPLFTVTARNRSQVAFELRSFSLDLVGKDKQALLVGGTLIDTRLPHVLTYRRSASVSGSYPELAKALMDKNIKPPVVIRGMVKDAIGDKFFSKEQTWDFSEYLPS